MMSCRRQNPLCDLRNSSSCDCFSGTLQDTAALNNTVLFLGLDVKVSIKKETSIIDIVEDKN